MDLRRLVACLMVAGTGAVLQPHAAQASLPVPYAVVGCIKGGLLQSESKPVGSSLVSATAKALEGKTVRVEGHLSPSGFHASALFIVDEMCREDLHKRYFLCDPCRTLPPHPPSRMLPRREAGRRVPMPLWALRDFDWPQMQRPGGAAPIQGIR